LVQGDARRMPSVVQGLNVLETADIVDVILRIALKVALNGLKTRTTCSRVKTPPWAKRCYL